jgi:periplasmic divalent cation tolerance protein
MTNKIVVLGTCRSGREARRIARALVEQRLAACANILGGPVASTYRWKRRVQSAKEFLVIIKTGRRRFAALCREVERLHSYDVPEIIALPILEGSRDYLDWISESTRDSARKLTRIVTGIPRPGGAAARP